MHVDIPVDPSGPDAKQWLINELGKPDYQAAKPTWFDQVSQAVLNWWNSLTGAANGGAGGLLSLLGVVVAVGLIVAAFFIFGMPRLNRSRVASARLIDSEDRRTSAQMRQSAEAAAAAGEWDQAVVELFRAIAQGLAERTLLVVSPGTTAHDVAIKASSAFPDLRRDLLAAASSFEKVRYLGRQGTREMYEQLRDLETTVRSTRPIVDQLSEEVIAR
jgi:hypothetical protein